MAIVVVHLPFSIHSILISSSSSSSSSKRKKVEVCSPTCGYQNEHLFATFKSNCRCAFALLINFSCFYQSHNKMFSIECHSVKWRKN